MSRKALEPLVWTKTKRAGGIWHPFTGGKGGGCEEGDSIQQTGVQWGYTRDRGTTASATNVF